MLPPSETIVERYLVVICPDLVVDGELGREARTFSGVMAAVTEFCPTVDPVAPGICALIARGPTRYFGGEAALVARIHDRLLQVRHAGHIGIGIADGLFGAYLAAQAPCIVPVGDTPAFLAPMPVGVLAREDLTSILNRLGITNLGSFADLPPESVITRFGREVATCHRVAGGLESELPGMRSPAIAGGRDQHHQYHQFDFWGGASAAEERAARAVDAVRKIAGPESVFVARLCGGRTPAEQSSLVLWDKRDRRQPSGMADSAPWPGQVPPPPPALVHHRSPFVQLVNAAGSPVTVSPRLQLDRVPDRFSIKQGPWQQISSWAGPWTEDTGWWTSRRHRSARIQVVTHAGAAHLLATREGSWILEATYD